MSSLDSKAGAVTDVDYIEAIATVNEHWDDLERYCDPSFTGSTFRIKQLDTVGMSEMSTLRNHNVVEVVDEYGGRVLDYRFTSFGEDVIDIVRGIDSDTLPETNQFQTIRNNREVIDSLPGEAGVEFEAGEFDISAASIRSLRESGMIERVEQNDYAADVWQTTEELTAIKVWL
ncbi:hypothetical protein OB919_18795 [Halobacteria archaeon AArc-curdl1]|uniref:Uncharacterized protein n=1 Tax=Natronosalvus hydrolyticus TaxID=2979988 RepID=A0AAP3E7V1_9EURY|nr:hypothetical protein [Halobacteria archaeon AArc-curdl1]